MGKDVCGDGVHPAHCRVHLALTILLVLLAGCQGQVQEESLADTKAELAGEVSQDGDDWNAHPLIVDQPQQLHATLAWTGSANLNLFLRSPSGEYVASALGKEQPETLEHTLEELGEWTLGVKAVTGTASYQLDLSLSTVAQQYDGYASTADSWQVVEVDVRQAATLSAELSWANTDADLNLFLKDPDGNIVASSLSGSQPEQVEYLCQKTGIWKLGIKTVSGSSSYTLRTWMDLTEPTAGEEPVPEEPDPVDTTEIRTPHLIVDPSGHDSNDGSLTSPLRTIEEAVSRLEPGLSIYLREGTYHEAVHVTVSGSSTSPILIAGYPGEKVVIDGQGQLPNKTKWAGLVMVEGDFITVQDIEVRNSDGRGVLVRRASHNTLRRLLVHHTYNAGIYIQGDAANRSGTRNNQIMDCEVFETARSHDVAVGEHVPPWPGAMVSSDAKDTLVTRNRVYNAHGEGIIVLRTSGAKVLKNESFDNWALNFYLDNALHVTLDRNLAYYSHSSTSDSYRRRFWRRYPDAPSSNIQIANESYEGAPSMGGYQTITNNIAIGGFRNISFRPDKAPDSRLDNTVIANNTLIEAVGGSRTAIGLNIESPQEGGHINTVIQNNIVVQDQGRNVKLGTTSGLAFSYNLWSEPPTDSAARSSQDIIGSPQLRDGTWFYAPGSADTQNARLQAGSPAIDAAKSRSDVTHDFFGRARPSGSAPDIGAHEF